MLNNNKYLFLKQNNDTKKLHIIAREKDTSCNYCGTLLDDQDYVCPVCGTHSKK